MILLKVLDLFFADTQSNENTAGGMNQGDIILQKFKKCFS
jgi:hypothetical protein